MPYATKRRANTEKILEQQARKCKKLSDFFTKNENAATFATMCDRNRTNVDKLSKLNMAPIDVPVELEIEVPDVDPVTKESGQLELHKDNNIECNAQLARDTSITTPPAPAQAPQASAQLTTEGFEATTEYYRGYPLDLTALTRRCGNDVLSLFYEKSRVSTENRKKARVFVKCCLCAEFEDEAKRFSANGSVYCTRCAL